MNKGCITGACCGGALGSIIRYALTMLIPLGIFPWATLIANGLGCLIAGRFLSRNRPHSNESRSFWITGFCGGLTTFSLLSFELFTFLNRGEPLSAFCYFLTSLLCTLPVYLFSRRTLVH